MAKREKVATISIVLLSIVLGFAGIATRNKGWGELYPFFAWQLYANPLAPYGDVTEYRIYTQASPTHSFIRQPVQKILSFSPDEYVYFLNNQVACAKSVAVDTVECKSRLILFCKYLYPDQHAYKIVAEKYMPHNRSTIDSTQRSVLFVFQ